MSAQGKLIVIEGPDGVGRSLHSRLLSERLEAHGVAVATLGLARSELMGDLIKENRQELHQLNWRTRALLYATDLHDQIIHQLQPLLDAGFVVIADRYKLTPLIREQIRNGDVQWIEGLYANIPRPDLTIILEAGGRRLLSRMMYNGSLVRLNSFEAGVDMALSPSITKSFLEYQKIIRSAFIEHASKDNTPIIHTKQSVKDVHSQIWDEVYPVLKDMIQPL